MRFLRMFSPVYWRRSAPSEGPDARVETPRPWHDSGVAEEVEAFLAGRLVDHMAAQHRPVPPWTALNRLAHADHAVIAGLVAGAGLERTAYSGAVHPWAMSERFAAAQFLARAGTPAQLLDLQRSTLVPLELDLVERARRERLTPEQVLDAAVDALDSYHSGA
ncbi:MAG TPA: hypothetical protein VFZ79_19420 [Acidimicrobiales bacterium]